MNQDSASFTRSAEKNGVRYEIQAHGSPPTHRRRASSLQRRK